MKTEKMLLPPSLRVLARGGEEGGVIEADAARLWPSPAAAAAAAVVVKYVCSCWMLLGEIMSEERDGLWEPPRVLKNVSAAPAASRPDRLLGVLGDRWGFFRGLPPTAARGHFTRGSRVTGDGYRGAIVAVCPPDSPGFI